MRGWLHKRAKHGLLVQAPCAASWLLLKRWLVCPPWGCYLASVSTLLLSPLPSSRPAANQNCLKVPSELSDDKVRREAPVVEPAGATAGHMAGQLPSASISTGSLAAKRHHLQ